MKNNSNKTDKMAKYFNVTPLTNGEKESLIDAYNAVEKTDGAWEWLKRPDVPPEDKGFMFCGDPMLNQIMKNMEMAGYHSGASFAYTMRTMEMIAKYGWNRYLRSFGLIPACPCRSAKGEVTGWCGVAGGVPGCEH